MKRKTANRRHLGQSEEPQHLYYLAVGMFFLLAFVLSFVNVGDSAAQAVTGNAVFNTTSPFTADSFLSKMFENWASGTLDVVVAKYLLFAILTFFIFSALNFAKIPESNFVQWLISIPIAFLAVAYITPAEIFSILTGYTALGLTLSVVVPFVVLLLFSSMLLSNEKIKSMTVGRVMLEVSIWMFYVGFLFYKIIDGFFFTDKLQSGGVLWVMLAVLVFSILILFFNKTFRNWVRSIGLELREAKSEVVKTSSKIGEDLIDPVDAR